MVLKLKEICISFIARHFDVVPNFDSKLLHSVHKEAIIEQLGNHDLFNYANKFRNCNTSSDSEHFRYQQTIVRNFFDSRMDSLKFNNCVQLNDSFLRLIAATPSFSVRSATFIRCHQVTGEVNKYFELNLNST